MKPITEAVIGLILLTAAATILSHAEPVQLSGIEFNVTPSIRADNESPQDLWSWGSSPKGKILTNGKLVDQPSLINLIQEW